MNRPVISPNWYLTGPVILVAALLVMALFYIRSLKRHRND